MFTEHGTNVIQRLCLILKGCLIVSSEHIHVFGLNILFTFRECQRPSSPNLVEGCQSWFPNI